MAVPPPERQLSIPSAAGMDRQLSTHSAAGAAKCFPVEFMLENGIFTMPVAQPPIVSLPRKVRTWVFSLDLHTICICT